MLLDYLVSNPDFSKAATALRKDAGIERAKATPPAGGSHVHIRAGGLWGSARAVFIAALAREAGRSLLVICDDIDHAEQLQEDLETLSAQQVDKNAGVASGNNETEQTTAEPPVVVFPPWDVLPLESEIPEADVLWARMRIIEDLDAERREAGTPSIIIAPIAAIMQPVPAPDMLYDGKREIRTGGDADPYEMAGWLVEKGYERVGQVEARGEFSLRGGILDIWPVVGENPVRIEFFDVQVESLRTFDPVTQRSGKDVESLRILDMSATKVSEPFRAGTHSLFDHLPESWASALIEPDAVKRQAELFQAGFVEPKWNFFSHEQILANAGSRDFVVVEGVSGGIDAETGADAAEGRVDSGEAAAYPVHPLPLLLDFETTPASRVTDSGETPGETIAELLVEGFNLVLFAGGKAERERLVRMIIDAGISLRDEKKRGHLKILSGRLWEGFFIPAEKRLVFSEHELLRRRPRRKIHGARIYPTAPIADFLDLKPGDYVVHTRHGIARYIGLTRMDNHGRAEDYLVLLFAGSDKLYVPATHIDLVQKYIGGRKAAPTLSKLGGRTWANRKIRAEKAIREIAEDLLRVQAMRETIQGIVFPPDDELQRAFEAEFPFEETSDQLHAVEAVKRDMESTSPMDRLLCGDVGFGKTEVAVRAAFKCCMAGRQCAVLVPTTILAEQHGRTFRERFGEYPLAVEVLSRFRSTAEQAAIARGLATGAVDCVIGTHRLLQKDIIFRDLGLAIIDEEQRFGVEHKEFFKRLRTQLDVLSLSATPIPRTLHMALLGLRDISNLAVPPADRQAIHTRVVRWSPNLLRRAVLREMRRGGQVYFVHNRIDRGVSGIPSIREIESELKGIVPEARIAVVHGRMSKHVLEDVMLRFLEREADILLSTSIIESGIDIPVVNTIFINEAELFGLAELHQLRGRVGRYKYRAYAYLLLPRRKSISPQALRRLKAVEEFAELGAGFKIAMRDMEIRGAGNILGAEQSGHIAEVGYEMYCRIIERVVKSLKGEEVRLPLEVTVALGTGECYIGENYVRDEAVRLDFYRRFGHALEVEQADELLEELRDRFGPPPPAAVRVVRKHRVRILADRAGVPYVGLESGDVFGRTKRLVLKFHGREMRRIEKPLASITRDIRLLAPDTVSLPVSTHCLREESKLWEYVEKTLSILATGISD